MLFFSGRVLCFDIENEISNESKQNFENKTIDESEYNNEENLFYIETTGFLG